MEAGTSSNQPAIIHIRVGIRDHKKYYSCEEEIINKFPKSTLGKCISLCKKDGRTKDNPIDIEHEGIFFEEILDYMRDQESFYRLRLYSKQTFELLAQEAIYHGLECLADKCKQDSAKLITQLEYNAQFWSLEIYYDRSELIETINAVDQTKQRGIFLFILRKPEKSSRSQVYSEKGIEYMEEVTKSIQFGFRSFILEEYDDKAKDSLKPSAIILLDKNQPPHYLSLLPNSNTPGRWYTSLRGWLLVKESECNGKSDISQMIDYMKRGCPVQKVTRQQYHREFSCEPPRIYCKWPHVPSGWLDKFVNSPEGIKAIKQFEEIYRPLRRQ